MKYEFKKLLTRSMVIVLIACAALNAFLFGRQQMSEHKELLADYAYYRKQLEVLKEDSKAALPFDETGTHGMALYTLKSQQDYLQMYPGFILDMPKRAEAAARLSKNSGNNFSRRNVTKTEADFKNMETLDIRADIDLSVTSVYDFVMSDILVLALVLVMCVLLFSKEYEKKLFPLVLATPSKLKAAVSKIAVLAISSFVMTAVIYGSNMLIGAKLFGVGDLGRPIQSISDFRTCSLWISCGGYLILGYLVKALSALMTGILVLALFTIFKKAVAVFFVIVCILGISFAFYTSVPVTSSLNALKFINIFYLSDSFELISRYQNINLFGFPISMAIIWPVVFGLTVILGTAVICVRFYTSAICRDGHLPFVVTFIENKLTVLWDGLNRHSCIWLHELRKALIGGKAVFLLAALMLLMAYKYDSAYRIKDSTDVAYEDYIHKIGGKITEDTQKFIEEEWEYLFNVEDATFYGGRFEALAMVEAQVMQALSREEELGIEPYLLDEAGYMQLLTVSKTESYDSVLVIVFCVLCCGGLFVRENTFDTKRLLRICPGGRRPVIAKLGISIFICTAVTVIVNVTRYMTIVKDYPVDYMNAPVQTVSVLSAYPHSQTLMSYMICLCILKLLGAILLAFAICAVSAACRSDASAMAGAIALFALPVAAIGADIGLVKYVSVFCYTGGNLFMQSGIGEQIWYGIFGIALAAASVIFVKKQWQSGMSV